MSDQSVESILSKAMSDAAFTDALFADPEKALAGYDLTAEEKAKFKSLTRTQFSAMTPEERKSFGIAVPDRPAAVRLPLTTAVGATTTKPR